MPFQDEQTKISAQDIRDRLQSWEDTVRVQDATEDHLNIDKHRYIIPAHKLLGAVRSALLPSVLKKLFSRHMHTREMPNESLEEETLIEEPGSRSASVLSVSGEILHLSHRGPSVRSERSPVAPHVLETITEGAEVDAEVDQAQRGAIAEGVPQECQIVVQELPPQERMPEELSTIQPQEEPEMRVVPHVEEMTSPKRSEEQLELDAAKMVQKLQPLWDAGSPVTFSRICPPGSTDRITAMENFELLLNMDHEGMISLRQNVHSCPPIFPRGPIVIHPLQ